MIDTIVILEESIGLSWAYKSDASDWGEKSSFYLSINMVFMRCCSNNLWWHAFFYYYFSLCYTI